MTGCLFLLCALAVVGAVPVARALGQAVWPEREPVLGLWVWQCLVAAFLVSCLTALVLSAAAILRAVRPQLFSPAPSGIEAVCGLSSTSGWAMALTLFLAMGAAWTVAALVRHFRAVREARGKVRTQLRERAPGLPADLPVRADPLLVVEDESPNAWWLPGSPSRLVVTTGGLNRLTSRQLDAVLAHERGHARARHDWLLQVSAALACGFPKVPLFTHFCERTHRLVELAADDSAARRCGRVTTALALIELNQHRGVFARASSRRLLSGRVDRLLAAPSRIRLRRRTLIAAAAAAMPLLPLLIPFVPGVGVLD
ncbi:M56 family metallopeptidase [Streptomyces parvus]|uniref:M56 family metallopeptidase n=1 Tax=Streptomyces parvus TaxID=66428 RepID=UPI0035DE7869